MQNSLSARNFPFLPGGAPWRFRLAAPDAGDAEDRIGGEGEDAEHEVAFDLDRAAHAQEPGAELVLQPGVDAFDHGAETVDHVVGVGMLMNFMRSTSLADPPDLGLVAGEDSRDR